MIGYFKKAFEGTVMETRTVQLRIHQTNIDRYENMLKTVLTDLERQFCTKARFRRTFGDSDAHERPKRYDLRSGALE